MKITLGFLTITILAAIAGVVFAWPVTPKPNYINWS